jgi:hypothetical protein
MDPDLVRQQEEEEAASRTLPRKALSPQARGERIEPLLPMPGAQASARPAARFAAAVQASAAPASMEAAGGLAVAPPPRTPGWVTALRGAVSVALGTLLGLIGGVMLGVKLQLVPWQSAAIGTAAGLFLGWQLAALVLRRRGRMGRLQAQRRALLPALAAYLALAAAMFLAPYLAAAPGAAGLAPEMAAFWKAVGAGAAIAIILAGALLRRALRRGSPPPG